MVRKAKAPHRESRQLVHSHWKQRWVSINPILFLSDTNGSILVHPQASTLILSPTRVLNISINSNRNRWNVTADDDGVGAQRMRFMCRESKKVAFVHVTSRFLTQGKERVDWVHCNVYALCLHGTMCVLVLSNELTMKPIFLCRTAVRCDRVSLNSFPSKTIKIRSSSAHLTRQMVCLSSHPL